MLPSRRMRLSLATALSFLIACEGAGPTIAPLPVTAVGAMLAVSDSVRTRAFVETLQLAQSVPMILLEETGFQIEFTSRECAAPNNVVQLMSPVSELLTGAGCQAPSVGFVWSFPGPFPAGSEIILTFASGAGGAGEIRVSGVFPQWTVAIEDGFDADFNDLVFTVSAVTVEVPECPADAAFASPTVVAALEDLWQASGFDGPVAERRERWAFLTDIDGQLDLRVLDLESDPCSVLGVLPVEENAIGWVHTHPFKDGDIIPVGACEIYPGGGRYRKGPSRGDLVTGQQINDTNEVGGLPGYVIDADGVIRFEVETLDVLPVIRSQEEFAGCIASSVMGGN